MFVHGTGDGERLWPLGGIDTFKATGDDTGDAYTLFQFAVRAAWGRRCIDMRRRRKASSSWMAR